MPKKTSKNKTKKNLDINKLQEALELAKKSESTYKSFLDNAFDLVQSVDRKGRFTYVNNAWCKTLGYSQAQALRMSFQDIIRKDQLDHCLKLFATLKKGHTIKNVETIFVTKTGKEVHVEGSVATYSQKGKFMYTQGFFRDISEQKQTEQRYKKLFESAPDSVLLVDKDGVIKDCSESTTEIYGAAKDKIIGRHVTDFMTAASVAQFKRDFSKISGINSVEGLKIVRKDKKVVEVWRKSYPLYDEAGNLKEILMYDRDMSDYMEMVQTVRQVNSQLAEKMTELERINSIMIGRELKMIELKEEIKELKKKLRKQ